MCLCTRYRGNARKCKYNFKTKGVVQRVSQLIYIEKTQLKGYRLLNQINRFGVSQQGCYSF